MRRFVTFALSALAMLAVALVSMFITIRIAIHGREALVPSLTGLTLTDAEQAASKTGLRLAIENRFYSEAPAGRVLAQDPAPGSRVRRDWAVRVTESLGTQRIPVPDFTGESDRAASITIHRLGLEAGAVVRFALPGDVNVVIAQTPAPNSAGADSPRVSLLVSDPTIVQQQAYVMPQLVGLTYAAAAERASAEGLHLDIVQPAPPAPVPVPAAAGAPATTNVPQTSASQPQQPATSAVTVHPASVITAQAPQAGRRVQQDDAVHVSVQDPPPFSAAIVRAN